MAIWKAFELPEAPEAEEGEEVPPPESRRGAAGRVWPKSVKS